MKKIVCIVGPTGVGKTDLAFKLAKKFDGELISADSVQVYKDLDIISGKDIPKNTQFVVLPKLSKNGINAGYYNYGNVPIFLLDVVDSSFSFTVSHFQELASNIVQYTGNQGKLPIVVGGTGLYIKSLIEGLDKLPEPDLELRKKLDSLDVTKLQGMISAEKLASMNASDRNNKRRLIRAIEIGSWEFRDGSLKISKKEAKKQYESLVIGLTCEREILKKRIDERVDARLKMGAMEEAKGLFENYENLAPQIKDANGYKQLFSYLKKEILLDEAVYRWKISEYRHAKNQMTWFQKYGDVKWHNITNKNYERNIENSLKKFLQ